MVMPCSGQSSPAERMLRASPRSSRDITVPSGIAPTETVLVPARSQRQSLSRSR